MKSFLKRAGLLMLTMLAWVFVNSQNVSIGDKPYFEVFGNVQRIQLEYYNVDFNRDGLFFCKNYKTTKKSGENTILIVQDEMGDITATYDAYGRLLQHNGFEIELSDLKYDSLNRLVKYTSYSGTDIIMVELKYDNEGNCSEKIENWYDDSNGKLKLDERIVYTFTILKKDYVGNWIIRKRNDGKVERRSIYYF